MKFFNIHNSHINNKKAKLLVIFIAFLVTGLTYVISVDNKNRIIRAINKEAFELNTTESGFNIFDDADDVEADLMVEEGLP